MSESIKVRMVDTDHARVILASKVQQVISMAKDFISVRPPSERDRFYLLRELRKSLEELEDYRRVVVAEQEELGL